MTVKNYLADNPDKTTYTIKQGRKSYLCNLFEAYQVFGNKEIKKITYTKDFDDSTCYGLPILHLA